MAKRKSLEEKQKENAPFLAAFDYQARLMGLTQKELASLAGVPLRVIRSYEQGQRSLENAGAESILRLSRALSCQIEDLL